MEGWASGRGASGLLRIAPNHGSASQQGSTSLARPRRPHRTGAFHVLARPRAWSSRRGLGGGPAPRPRPWAGAQEERRWASTGLRDAAFLLQSGLVLSTALSTALTIFLPWLPLSQALWPWAAAVAPVCPDCLSGGVPDGSSSLNSGTRGDDVCGRRLLGWAQEASGAVAVLTTKAV